MRVTILVFLMLTLASCFEQERNCTDYKTGVFEFSYIQDGQSKTGKFTRSDSLSIDFYEDKVDSASVRWINDCEFILKQINPKTLSEEKPIHMKILSTSKRGYTFEYKYAVKEAYKKQKVYKGEAIKIE